MTMRTLWVIGLAVGTLAAGMHAQSAKALRTAMSACGPRDEAFKVRLKPGGGPVPSTPGKAVVFVIGNSTHFGEGPGAPILRVGVDGSWVGAVKGSGWPSYVALLLTAGVHHFCAQWQGPGDATSVALNVLNVQPGESYWLVAEGISPEPIEGPVLTLDPVNADEGKLLIAAGRQALAIRIEPGKP